MAMLFKKRNNYTMKSKRCNMYGHLQERYELKYRAEQIVNAVREYEKKMERVEM